MRDRSLSTLHDSRVFPSRCEAVFRVVPKFIAYLGYYELPSKSAFRLFVHTSCLLDDVHARPAFGLGESKGRRSFHWDEEHHLLFVEGLDRR